jgi:hypothetical protein
MIEISQCATEQQAERFMQKMREYRENFHDAVEVGYGFNTTTGSLLRYSCHIALPIGTVSEVRQAILGRVIDWLLGIPPTPEPDFTLYTYQCVDHCKNCVIGQPAPVSPCDVLYSMCENYCKHYNLDSCSLDEGVCLWTSFNPQNCKSFKWNGFEGDKVRS